MSFDTIFGLIRPISLMKSKRRCPIVKASIDRSLETSSAKFFMMLQRCMYERSDSPFFCVQALIFSIDAGLL
jgi:hypothetical protein